MTIVQTDPDYLVHYGILGMKWGVRRYQNLDGSLTAAGRKRYDDSEVGENDSAHTRSRKTIRNMTDEELNAALSRRQKEKQLQDLNRTPAEKVATDVAVNVLKGVLIAAGTGLATYGLYKAMQNSGNGELANIADIAFPKVTKVLQKAAEVSVDAAKTPAAETVDLAKKVLEDVKSAPVPKIEAPKIGSSVGSSANAIASANVNKIAELLKDKTLRDTPVQSLNLEDRLADLMDFLENGGLNDHYTL